MGSSFAQLMGLSGTEFPGRGEIGCRRKSDNDMLSPPRRDRHFSKQLPVVFAALSEAEDLLRNGFLSVVIAAQIKLSADVQESLDHGGCRFGIKYRLIVKEGRDLGHDPLPYLQCGDELPLLLKLRQFRMLKYW